MVISLITIAVSLATLAFTAWRYVAVRREQQRQRRYENYHELLRRLVSPGDDGAEPKLDSQIAVAFELRNYWEYRGLSVRLLQALLEKWTREQQDIRLTGEVELTLAHLRRRWPRRT